MPSSILKPWQLKFIFCLLFITCYLSFITPANASSLGLSIYPPIFQATIKPGKTITQAFTIQNLSEKEREFTTRVVPFTPLGNKGQPLLKPDQKPEWLNYFSLANADIALNQPFSIKPNSNRQLILTIAIPLTAPITDHYCTLLITTSSQEKNLNSLISGSVGAHLLLTINNSASPPTRLELTHFSPDQTPLFKLDNGTYVFDNLDRLTFSATLKNFGIFLSQTKGFFQITKASQPLVMESLLPFYVLAGSERDLIASGSGKFVLEPNLTNIGQFEANLIINADNASVSGQIKLLLLPIKTTLSLIISLLILFSLSRFSKSKK